MEALKYRGKRTLDLPLQDKWVKGYLVKTNKHEILISDGTVRDDMGMMMNFVKVVPESVGQNIGLKTKGREVHDGDIFFDERERDEGDERHYFVVKWLQQKCSFVFMDYGDTVTNWDKFEENTWNEYPIQVTQESLDTMHYAGNYFDNPELLTKEYEGE